MGATPNVAALAWTGAAVADHQYETISGSGNLDLDGYYYVRYIFATVTTLGDACRYPQLGDDEHVIRVGYLALAFTDDDISDFVMITAPIWIDFRHCWLAGPNGLGYGDSWNRLRYSLSPGTVVDLDIRKGIGAVVGPGL